MVDTTIWAFQPSDVSRLTGFAVPMLRRWSKDLYPPQWESGFYSFRDVVGLRVLTELRVKHRIPRQRLVQAAKYLRKHSSEPWTELRIGVAPGQRVAFWNRKSERWEAADGTQQTVFPLAIDRVVKEAQQEVQRMRKRKAEDLGQLRRQRGVMSNTECIAGTRIPVAIIADYLRKNATVASLMRAFPGLARDDIEAVRREKLARSA
jgi:uncharacterized protein (DUF433 family)